MTLIQINQLSKQFKLDRNPFYALRNVNLQIHKGEILGLVGASGSGKTTLGKILLDLIHPTEGQIDYHYDSLSRRKSMQMVFQDPHSSLNPKMTVYELVSEPLIIHRITSNVQARVLELLDLVEIDSSLLQTTSDQLSGGQKQRVAIARALASEPEFIVFDEAVSALDASLQAQIINLLKKLHKEFNLTFLFISHDLSIVKYLTDRVAVLYEGQIVEMAPTKTLFESPLHPYTRELLNALKPAQKVKELNRHLPITGEHKTHMGCEFCEHCPVAEAVCWEKKPCLKECMESHWVSCHRQ